MQTGLNTHRLVWLYQTYKEYTSLDYIVWKPTDYNSIEGNLEFWVVYKTFLL